jgi:flagellar hook-basal body complex protein FliE
MNDPIGHLSNAANLGQIKPMGFPHVGAKPGLPVGGANSDFMAELKTQIEAVNHLQNEADTAANDLVAGRRDDLEGVMIATEKADTAFRMLLAVRNKMLDAYDEIKNLRV